MKKESMITILISLLCWFILSCRVDNSILLPGPFDVIDSMFAQLQRDDFISVIFHTSMRTIKGCLISLVLGGGLGVVSGNSRILKAVLNPFHQVIKTIPNITYMILILIWLGHENSVTVIVFFILFPVFYVQFLDRTEQMEAQNKELLTIYPVTKFEKIIQIDFPLLLPSVFSSLKTGIGLGFKICVMAEILGQVKIGIGRQMNYGRLNLDIASVFAWTIWLILISLLFQKLIDVVQKIINHKMQ